MTCSGDNGDCPKPVEKAGLCAGHRKRKNNGLPVNTPLRTYDPRNTLMEAVHAVAGAESDSDFERAIGRFFKAVFRYKSRRKSDVTKGENA